jgi:hypothetical protein
MLSTSGIMHPLLRWSQGLIDFVHTLAPLIPFSCSGRPLLVLLRLDIRFLHCKFPMRIWFFAAGNWTTLLRSLLDHHVVLDICPLQGERSALSRNESPILSFSFLLQISYLRLL